MYGNELDTKPIEIYGNTMFNTKTLAIEGFMESKEEAYPIDLVTFALSVDPLAANTSYISPYHFTDNNPILFVDPNRRKTNYLIVNKDGNVEIGDATADKQGDASMVDFGPKPENAVGGVHSHPDAGKNLMVPIGGGNTGEATITGDPSPSDDRHTASPGYYNAIVSPKGIVLYNYEPIDGGAGRPNLSIPNEEIPR